MAILMINNSKALPTKVVKYALREDKCACYGTIGLLYGIPYHTQFLQTAKRFGKWTKHNERKYYHAKISFDPSNTIANGGKMKAEDALGIALEFAEKTIPGHEVVVAIHDDKPHLHAHIIVNSVNYEDGRKLQIKNRDVAAAKDLAYTLTTGKGFISLDWRKAMNDRILRHAKNREEKLKDKLISIQAERNKAKNGIDAYKPLSQREKTVWSIKQAVDTSIYMSRDFNEFEKSLNSMGIILPRNTEKTISFKMAGVDYSVRGATLGDEYTKARLVELFEKREVPEWWDIATKNKIFSENRLNSISDIDKQIEIYNNSSSVLMEEKTRLTERNKHAKSFLGLLVEYEKLPEQRSRNSRHAAIEKRLDEFGINPKEVSSKEIQKVIFSREAIINKIDVDTRRLFNNRMDLRKVKEDINKFGKDERGLVLSINRGQTKDLGIEL